MHEESVNMDRWAWDVFGLREATKGRELQVHPLSLPSLRPHLSLSELPCCPGMEASGAPPEVSPVDLGLDRLEN